MESMFARHLCLTLLRAITVQSPTATHTGKEIIYTILPPPDRQGTSSCPGPSPGSRKIEARAERSSGSHQVARAHQRPHALTPIISPTFSVHK